jgi:hypothetical protein
VTCPSARLCLLADNTGHVLSSTAPASGKWQIKEVDRYDDQDDGPSTGSLSAIACASTTLCWTADPSDGDGGEYGGLWYRSTAPASDAWKLTHLWDLGTDEDGSTEMVSAADIACASATVCVGTGDDASGQSVESDVWLAGHTKPVLIGRVGGTSASCGGPTLCAVTGTTNLTASRTPATRSSWHTVSLETKPQQLTALDCPSAGTCLVADSAGRIGTSATPVGPARSWSFKTIDPGNALTALSCASAKLCFALDTAGNVVAGRS